MEVTPFSSQAAIQKMMVQLAPKLGGTDFSSILQQVLADAEAGRIEASDERLKALPYLSKLSQQTTLFSTLFEEKNSLGSLFGGGLFEGLFALPEWARNLEQVSDDPRLKEMFSLWYQLRSFSRSLLSRAGAVGFSSLV